MSATEGTWRLPSSPIVEKNICIFYVVVVAVVVVVVVAVGVDDADDDADDEDEEEEKEKKEEDMLREKSNNPNLKGGEKSATCVHPPLTWPIL